METFLQPALVSKPAVCEEVRCLEACFLLLFSRVFLASEKVCLWLIYMSRPSQTCVLQDPGEQGSQTAQSSKGPLLPGQTFWVALQWACQSVLIGAVHSCIALSQSGTGTFFSANFSFLSSTSLFYPLLLFLLFNLSLRRGRLS